MLIRTSVSGDPAHRDDVFRMSSYLESQLRQYGVETKAVELGTHIMDGHNLKLPPALLGRIGDDKSKKTILIYGHFDVQPVCRLPSSDSSSPS
jgi:Cys-Gly metallodipeptidase DUG1